MKPRPPYLFRLSRDSTLRPQMRPNHLCLAWGPTLPRPTPGSGALSLLVLSRPPKTPSIAGSGTEGWDTSQIPTTTPTRCRAGHDGHCVIHSHHCATCSRHSAYSWIQKWRSMSIRAPVATHLSELQGMDHEKGGLGSPHRTKNEGRHGCYRYRRSIHRADMARHKDYNTPIRRLQSATTRGMESHPSLGSRPWH